MQKKQLFFLPFAGGSVHSFDVLLPYLTKEREVYVFEYAGHGNRRKEPFYASLQQAAKDAALFVLEKRNDMPYEIFGYSMGSLVVYEMFAQGFLQDVPEHIFLASHDSPDSNFEGKTYFNLSEKDFLDVLKHMGGMDRIDEKIMQNRFFQKLYFEPIRADYKLLIEYQMGPKMVLPANATVFYAPNDIPRERIEMWKPFLLEGSQFVAIGEKHFFLESHTEQLTNILLGKV